MRSYTKDKVGVNVRERNEIIGCLFDTEAGLFDCDNTLTFEHHLQTAQQSFEKYPKLASYFQSRITPLLQEHFCTVQAKKPAMPNAMGLIIIVKASTTSSSRLWIGKRKSSQN